MSEDVKAYMRKTNSVAIIDMTGDVTSFADKTINTVVNTAVDDGFQKIVFNFTQVNYINSSGIAILIGIVTNLAAKGVSFTVYGLTSHFKKIFRMIGLTQYVTVMNTEEDALNAF